MGSSFTRDHMLFPRHWTTLFDAICQGAVQRLGFGGIDFSALADDVFMIAVSCRGLQSLVVKYSVVPSRLVTDALIRSSVAKGLARLWLIDNKLDSSIRLSDDAVLDFCFPADATAKGQAGSLMLDGSAVTDIFITKLFEVSA